MQIDVVGRNVLVSGGVRGLGRGIVLAFARAGANVVTCYRQESAAVDSLVHELKQTSGTHHVMRADVAVPADLDGLLEETRRRLGSLDTVVSNAGMITFSPVDALPLDTWERTVATNLTGAFGLVQRSLPLLSAGSSIVVIGSRVATAGMAGAAHYLASKAGLAGLTRALCKELGPRGIRVNLVAPGVIETEATVDLPMDRRTRHEVMSPLNRLGTVDEIAGAVLFLASDLAGFITGETLNVDGGV